MLAEERRYRIVQFLRERASGSASVAEISDLLGVSRMTVRRDLDWLESGALLQRVHGGAIINPDTIYEKPFTQRGTESGEEKQSIGLIAAELVEPGETILLDAGTTTLQMVRGLAGKRNLTVVTNALPIAQELCQWPHVATVLLGGILKHEEVCTVGPPVIEELANLSVDKVFLSGAGLTLEKGITDPDLRETAVKQAMIRAASDVILMIDSSKWGVITFAQVAPLAHVHRIVTDDGLPAAAIQAIEAEGVQVITPSRAAREPVDAAG
jgi:DeoR family fructose operon transcriptional repressor